MREKIVLIGAGSAVFTRGLAADLLQRGWDCDLALVDTDAAALETAELLVRRMIAANGAPVRLVASTDRREVLAGATAVICTIAVGGRRAWEQDVFIPRRHGIFQPVGDTVMPGGTARALRMIPAMVAIAEDVAELCPDALFFNYGNPMAPVCRAVRKATAMPLVGLCHGVVHVARYLAGILGVDVPAMTYTAVGMNHLTWFTEVRTPQGDGLAALRAMAVGEPPAGSRAAAARAADPFSWELLELFGAFPAVLDRHVTEFFPHLFAREGSYDGRTLGVNVFPFEKVIASGDASYSRMAAEARDAAPLPPAAFRRAAGEHEQVIDIIDAIRSNAGTVFSVNLPNTGQLPNVPTDIVVECPAAATAGGLQPLPQAPLPPGIHGTLATRFQWVETVVDAALAGSRTGVVQALLLDGAVGSIASARRLADDLLCAHEHLLPEGLYRAE